MTLSRVLVGVHEKPKFNVLLVPIGFSENSRNFVPREKSFLSPAENISGPGGKFRPPRKNSDIFDTFRKTVTFRRNHACTLGKADFFRGFTK